MIEVAENIVRCPDRGMTSEGHLTMRGKNIDLCGTRDGSNGIAIVVRRGREVFMEEDDLRKVELTADQLFLGFSNSMRFRDRGRDVNDRERVAAMVGGGGENVERCEREARESIGRHVGGWLC